MANHKSSLKRIRQDKKKALHNHYYAKTMRNAVRKLRAMTNKDEAVALYPKVQKMLDKLAKTIQHRRLQFLTDCSLFLDLKIRLSHFFFVILRSKFDFPCQRQEANMTTHYKNGRRT